jgi:hypothetical protein
MESLTPELSQQPAIVHHTTGEAALLFEQLIEQPAFVEPQNPHDVSLALPRLTVAELERRAAILAERTAIHTTSAYQTRSLQSRRMTLALAYAWAANSRHHLATAPTKKNR